MKNGSNARAPHTQNARAGHPPVVQKKGRNPLHHCTVRIAVQKTHFHVVLQSMTISMHIGLFCTFQFK